MDVFNLIGAAVGLDAMYRGKAPKVLPEGRRRFCVFPKWVAPVRLPAAVREADDLAAALGEVLEPEGFALETRDAGTLTFARGNVLGDFSVKAAKVRLTFETPPADPKAPAHVRAEYAVALPAFDTGDLARLLKDVVAKVEAAG